MRWEYHWILYILHSGTNHGSLELSLNKALGDKTINYFKMNFRNMN